MAQTTPAFPMNSFQFQPGAGPAFGAYLTTAQSIPSGAWTTILFQTKEFDTNNAYDPKTGRFQPKVAGIYQVNGAIYWSPGQSAAETAVGIGKNGTINKEGSDVNPGTYYTHYIMSVSSLYMLNGTSDYLTLMCYQGTGSAATLATGSGPATFFNAAMIRGL